MSTGSVPATTAAPPSLARRQIITTGALALATAATLPAPAVAAANAEILSAEEAIHQERVFKARRLRVYEALTVERQFDEIVRLSGVMQADAMANMQQPTNLSPREGGGFALFGGYIVGRQIELAPHGLIVQAWRVLSWPAGKYSIARFEFVDQGDSTQLVFDHTAFPKGQAEHLASGWQQHYWDPLMKFLAGGMT